MCAAIRASLAITTWVGHYWDGGWAARLQDRLQGLLQERAAIISLLNMHYCPSATTSTRCYYPCCHKCILGSSYTQQPFLLLDRLWQQWEGGEEEALLQDCLQQRVPRCWGGKDEQKRERERGATPLLVSWDLWADSLVALCCMLSHSYTNLTYEHIALVSPQ